MSTLRAAVLPTLLALLAAGACGRERASEPPAPAAENAKATPGGAAEAPANTPDVSPWRTDIGAKNGEGKRSELAISGGTLTFSGGADTREWQMAWRDADVVSPPGEAVLTYRIATEGVRQEGQQYVNANAVLAFYDAQGARLGLVGSPPLSGDTPAHAGRLVAPLPEGTTRVSGGFLLSMTGTMRVSDVDLKVRPLAPWSTATAAEAWDHLVAHVVATYPFDDPARDAPRFEAHAARARPGAAAAPDRRAFTSALIGLLSALEDPHVAVSVDGKAMPTVSPPELPRVWNFDLVKARVEGSMLTMRGVQVVGLGGGIVYINISTWQLPKETVERLLATLDEITGARGVIIDVRPNTGGNEAFARAVASRFASAEVVYAKHRYRLGPGYGPWVERRLAPDARATNLRGLPVAVLQSRWAMSSNEGFVAMMRALPNATTIGTTTRGASRDPKPLTLTTDIEVIVSRWQNALPDGTLTENVGIPPQIAVDAPESAYASADPILAKALEVLSQAQ